MILRISSELSFPRWFRHSSSQSSFSHHLAQKSHAMFSSKINNKYPLLNVEVTRKCVISNSYLILKKKVYMISFKYWILKGYNKDILLNSILMTLVDMMHLNLSKMPFSVVFYQRRCCCNTCWSCQMQHQAFGSKFLTHQRLNSFLELHSQFWGVANCKI